MTFGNDTIRLTLAILLFALLPGQQAVGQEIDRALHRETPNWYDPESGQVRPLSDFQATYTLQDGTRSEARNTAATNFSDSLTRFWDSIVDFFGWLRSQIPSGWLGDGTTWFWLLLGLLALTVAGVLIYVMLKLDSVQAWLGIEGAGKSGKRRKRPATIEDLPFELEGESLSEGNLLLRARQEHDQGNLQLAIVFLFSHLLLKLDQKELIRLQKGKTNRIYALEVRRNDRSVLELYQQVMHAFERSFFGHHPLSADELAGMLNRTEGWA